ncbi:preprotein translocase subunit SecA [Kallotenue papyrolyticum]|uniref:preprotein translocase subunit SecA n=1 Tax=Kallotenue papyrolyticum TaxID=1325125 RepID=UPI000492E4FA|nr:preprotein translocase subunit SecA [Kallotenue papyrolyticum]
MFKWLGRLFSGDSNERVINDLYRIVDQINALEPEYEALTNEQLRAKTDEFRRRLREGETLDDLLPEAFAAVREAAKRTVKMRHYDVQLLGGIVLHQGKIAEMKTGEGKTLVATLPLYLNALTGKGCHLVTVNDYLAKRDAGWNGPIYHLLGLSVAAIAHDFSAIYDPDYLDPKSNLEDERLVHWRPVTRREAYLADITYGTNNEFGFDYLRDNIAQRLEQTVQRPLHYAIVDEVDNILIDEARTPLIISGPARAASDEYRYFAHLVKGLRGIEQREYDAYKKALDFGDSRQRAEAQRALEHAHYVLDLKHRGISLTDAGIEEIERRLKQAGRIPADASIYEPEFYELTHYLENAVKAEYLFKRDKDYIVQNNEVIIVDEQTGRTMPGRRWSDGLHEAVEAKEGVRVQDETAVYATITIQNYFRMYEKLAGMTGTALTEAEEFMKIYKLDVVPIPTNRPMIRQDLNDQIYRSEEAKYRAVVRDILQSAIRRQPVLVGTASIENSERLSSYLKPGALRNLALSSVLMTTIRETKGVSDEVRKAFAETLDVPIPQVGQGVLRQTALALNLPADALAPEIVERFAALLGIEDTARLVDFLRNGLPHQVLNAKLHEQEARVVAQAGRPGAVTIATNMAGRGTDILLGGNPEALAAQYLEENGVRREQLRAVARALLEGQEAQARQLLEKHGLPEVVLEELQRSRRDYDGMLAGFEANPALFFLHRYVEGPAETFAARWAFVNDVLQGEIGLARQLAQQTPGLREEQIAQIQATRADLERYRQDPAEFLATQLFDRIYAARARLVNAVLGGRDEEAQRIVAQTPTFDASLIEGIRQIKRQVEADAALVRELGGLRIIGTERHEARRIDNQLRGRAGRQGDPGVSRFYISLEDELMKRFGPSIDRVRSFMGRAGFEDDIPIEMGVISKSIESAQTKVEGYNFDVRKRVVEYDDVMNKQREVIYARRRAILEQGEEQRRIQMLVQRYLGNYRDWVADQVEELAAGAGSATAPEIREQLARLLPGSEQLDLEALRAADEARRAELLQPLVAEAEAQRHPLRLLLEDVAEFVELDVDAAFAALQHADRAAVERYLDERWRESTEGDLEQRIKDLFYQELDLMVDRYLDDYEGWMTGEIEKAVEATSVQATNTINVAGTLRRMRPLLPQVEALTIDQQEATPELVQRELEALIPRSYQEGNHLRLFANELQHILPFVPGQTPDQFLAQFHDALDGLLTAVPAQERETLIQEWLAPVRASLQPIYGGQQFSPEEAQAFTEASNRAWIFALDRFGTLDDDARARGLEQLVNRAFDRWRALIGVDLLNRYSRELMLSAIDREWADYLTAMEDLRQGIGLQGLAQRDPLVAYKTQAFKMFEELLDTIDRTTVRTFFPNLPRFVNTVVLQQAQQGAARQRELKVGPNEPCPCGSGKKFKKCHGAPTAPALAAGGAVAAVAVGPGGANGMPARPLTQQQRQAQSGQTGQRRKSKGRNAPRR